MRQDVRFHFQQVTHRSHWCPEEGEKKVGWKWRCLFYPPDGITGNPHFKEVQKGVQSEYLIQVSKIVPGQCWSGHVWLDPDGHGDPPTADAAQLFSHGDAVAKVKSQTSIFCTEKQRDQSGSVRIFCTVFVDFINFLWLFLKDC